jgi:hypothetical protein
MLSEARQHAEKLIRASATMKTEETLETGARR